MVLTQRKLTTFKNQTKDSITEILDMNSCISANEVSRSQAGGKDHAFNVITQNKDKSQQAFVFYANSKQERDTWMAALQNVIN